MGGGGGAEGGGKLGGGSRNPCRREGLGKGGRTGHWFKEGGGCDSDRGGYCVKSQGGGM